jgi:hypothetical protein
MSSTPPTFRRYTLPSEVLLEVRLAVHARMDRLRARLARPRLARQFADVEVLGLFIGYPRSGHSVVGSVIDAHPEAITAHRLNSLKFVQRGDSLDEIFYMALLNAMRFSRGGRKLTGYSYAIDGLWQGRYRTLRVVCDQEGEQNLKALAADPGVLDRLRAGARCDIRFLHVVRNPYDNITTMAIRSLHDLPSTIDRYFALCESAVKVRERLGAYALLDVRHEELIARPDEEIRRLMSFLDLPVDGDYVARCRELLHESPHRSRERMAWSPELVDLVARRASAFPWLEGYRYHEAEPVP